MSRVLRAFSRLSVALTAGSVAVVIAGCEPEIRCDVLCERMLACEITFAPSDDVEGAKIAAGERTDQESCELGCGENPAVTPDSANCVDDITDVDTDPVTCQEPVAACFNIQLGT